MKMKNKIINIVIVLIIAILLIGSSATVQAVNAPASTTNTTVATPKAGGNSNANLSNLGTKKYDFTGFRPDEDRYDITVPESFTEIEVYAETQDKGATYVVTGDKDLKRGENIVTITVTASDGVTQKDYYIVVRRLGNPDLNEVEEKEKEQEENTAQEEDSSGITRYSEPHTEKGWYIIGISLAVVTVLLIIFIIIDDYKPEPKAKKKKAKIEEEEENEEEEEKEEETEKDEKEDEKVKTNSSLDSQETKVLNLEELKSMKGSFENKKKGKHS